MMWVVKYVAQWLSLHKNKRKCKVFSMCKLLLLFGEYLATQCVNGWDNEVKRGIERRGVRFSEKMRGMNGRLLLGKRLEGRSVVRRQG